MMEYLSTRRVEVNLSPCVVEGEYFLHRDLHNSYVYFSDLAITLLKGTSAVEKPRLHLKLFLEHCWESVKKPQPVHCKKCVSYFTCFDHVCLSGRVRTLHGGFSRSADIVKKISARQIFFLWCGTADALSVFEVILAESLDGVDGGPWRASKQRLQRAAQNISPCQQLKKSEWSGDLLGLAQWGQREGHGRHLTWQRVSTRGQNFASFSSIRRNTGPVGKLELFWGY